ncbi:MAG TPA: acylphosphatase [Spirochaetia bacterium]|nr:acylphosphatase [Spirochaetia bacterium]
MAHDEAKKDAFTATVHGRVQGVGFRYYTRSMAHRLNVRGYVQNLPDGSVRVECEGQPAAVRQMAEWLRKGPSSAKVNDVDLHWKSKKAGYATFTVEH